MRYFYAALCAHEERNVKALKAIIMAGGEGSRLRPLTCDCPKPMLRLMGRPLMEYAVELLKRHGIREIAATLGYLPDAITDYFGDGGEMGVQLHYYIETTPLGTAGSVKRARDFLSETFIVLSGDGVTDIDLSAALRFHREKRALATLVLRQSAHPQEYGMVVTGADGRILSFHEKPGRGDVYSDKINTGIYILEPELLNRIPDGGCYDFGHDFFPALLAEDLPVYGYTAEGYWCDVGDVAAYLRVHADALDGRIRLNGLVPCNGGAPCHIEEPVYIAPGATIDPSAHIGPYSVIGEGCNVAAGAGVKHSILFCGARAERGAQLRGCIAGTDAVIGEDAQLFEESVVGTRSRIGARAMLPPGVKLWPEKSLPEGERPEENIVWGSRREQKFISGALCLESPAQAARAAQACMAQMQPREVLVGRGASTVAAAMWHAAAAGIMAQGIQIIDAGMCSLPQLRHSLGALRSGAAIFIEENRLTPLNANGALLEEKLQRGILKRIERQDFPSPFRAVTPPILPAGCSALSYIAALAAAFEADPRLSPRVALCAEGALLETSEQAFQRAGLALRLVHSREELRPGEGEIGVFLPDGGETALFSDAEGALTEVQRQIACAWTALEKGESRLILPVHATRAIDSLGANTLYFPGETAAWMNALAQSSPLQFRLQHDGLFFALCFLSRLTERGLSLRQWRQQAPGAYRSERGVALPERESGRILRALAQNAASAELGGGVRLPRKGCWAWLGPDDTGAQLNIIAEAGDMETARELCDFYDSEIHRLLKTPPD